jgi:hypothetical protein
MPAGDSYPNHHKGNHYLPTLKENQKSLYKDTLFGFKTCSEESVSEEWEYDHGRNEVRKCSIIPSNRALLPEIQKLWSGLKTLIKVEASRQIKDRLMQETRYYISDEEGLSAAYYNSLLRGHWALRITYTGIWTLLSGKIAVVQEKTMRLKIFLP